MINTIIQIILSLFIISIMAFIGYSIYNKEYISNINITNTTRKVTKVFNGIMDFTVDKNIEIETFNKNDFTYLDINPSINQNGGVEYSYNFWLFFDIKDDTKTIGSINKNINDNSITDNTLQDKYRYIVLFYKGEKQAIPFKTNNYECENIDYVKNVDIQVLIKNPLVKIRNDAKEIIIEYNNINYPESYNINATKINCYDDDVVNKQRNKNKFGIKDIDVENYKQKYNMITIVFQEQPKGENIINNKANCKVYMNGKLITNRLSNTKSFEEDELNNFRSRVMKSNFSKLRIFPEITTITGKTVQQATINKIKLNDKITEVSPLQMADLTYFNYAITQSEINNLYKKGFNKYEAIFKKKSFQDFIKGYNDRNYTVEQV